ncbi:uncharacterized protein LOC141721564 isoform X1 [Apium graveolens]|uniref:uncharacterized protein LOC141721564 isoform X1 n=1 Tax=Apium graveolens TaxID=4045 RepID=UPI003D79809B
MDAKKLKTNSQSAANYWSSQDDACRSPELSHIPSTSSKLGEAKVSDHDVPGFVPDDRTCSSAEPLSEKRWRLNLEPTVRHLHNGNTNDSNALRAESGVYGAVLLNKNVTITGEKQLDVEGDIKKCLKGNGGNLVDSPNIAFLDSMKNDRDDKMEESNVVTEDDLCRVPNKEVGESWCVDENWKDLDPYKCSVHEKPEKLCSELESQWIEVEKNEPWWRTADKDDLTSFVSCKKLDQFENCDLPQPQSKHGGGPSECTQSVDEAMILASLGKKVDKETDNLDEQTSEVPNSVSMFQSQHIMGLVQCFPSSSDRPISRTDSFATEEKETEALQRLESDLTKTQLLEALCHSQTRAREAEKAARQAYDEKEHIVKHFFMQASHLFAYRQWHQMLQIETLCLQHKSNTDECLQRKNIEDLQLENTNDESMSAKFPGLLAVSREGRKMGKVRKKATKRVGIPNYQLRRSIIGFAIGLSLASAGLLLGWTLGRFFPAM